MEQDSSRNSEDEPEDLYLNLLQMCLTGTLGGESYRVIEPMGSAAPLNKLLKALPFAIVRKASQESRAEGRDWPAYAETMVGTSRLANLRNCISDVIQQGVPGDILEAGVWRGGASIFMRGVLKAYRDTERTVWVVDSFQGLPKPNPAAY